MNHAKNLIIGFDDTDSRKGMCTTFLAYKIVEKLKRENCEFVDYPKLIRFNPNIPWKTRGNGAVCIKIKTKNSSKIKNKIKNLFEKYSDVKNGANPGLVFYENEEIPKKFMEFSKLALWQLINRNIAKKFALENHMEFFYLGNGQGLIGAIGAIGYQFDDYTFELLSYRKNSNFGKTREISGQSVKTMQEKTFPFTFNSFDTIKNRVLITPHGPDPVFYGVRGENVKSLLRAKKLLRFNEKLAGHMIFKSNQGTGDHLKNELDVDDLRPYSSGTITGIIYDEPKILRGGHVVFSLSANSKIVFCAVYKETGITNIAKKLVIGDKICLGGGIKKSTKKLPRTLNVEFIRILKLEKIFKETNPKCSKCNKKMKSKGKDQKFQCVKCGSTSSSKEIFEIKRNLKKKLYIPVISAHRHLTRPHLRLGIINIENKFDDTCSWFSTY